MTKLTASDADGSDQYGKSVSSAGDIDGDGYVDVVVGANYDDDEGTVRGSIYVYYGSVSGLRPGSEQLSNHVRRKPTSHSHV